uniref:very-long-chain enoyl-CoA reductase n=1 Tax=Aceria tosichella TaxID=561515 RepID=A0A6G1S4A0_9ACAR
MELDIVKASQADSKTFVNLRDVDRSATIGQIKQMICKQKPALYPERIALRTEVKGKSLSDSMQLSKLELNKGKELYFKDLGPQVGWSTVFLAEYAGPLFCYMITYWRPAIFYGPDAASKPYHYAVNIAAACWVFHYVKRILETLFVHRFSHATMPMANLFKNCSYYWGFAFFVGYYVNHPLYTPASFKDPQIYAGLLGFLFSELGNFSIHVALRNLRPPGTTERKIPRPTSNPFTLLFNFVSCPNYTYEIAAWMSFSLMTQALPALLFTLAGGGQMVLWALGKHRNYRKEFPNYPRGRKSIIPFVI